MQSPFKYSNDQFMASLYNIERNKTYKKQIIKKVSYHPRDSALENRINAEKSDKKHVKKH